MSRLGRSNIEVEIGELRTGLGATVIPGDAVDHGSLLGLADDDHGQYVHISAARTIQVAHTFNPTSPGPAFALGANAQGYLVSGLYADHVNKSVVAGAGMTGGGTLASGSGVTLNVIAADTSLTINADSMQVRLATNPGLEVATGLKLGTPGTLSVSSSNNLSGSSHTHTVTASSDVSAGVAALLKSTAAGGLTLASLTTSGAADIGQGLTAAASTLRAIYHTHGGVDHVHLVINPSVGWTLDEQFGVDIDDNLLVRGWIVGKHALQIPDALMICHYDGQEPFETNFSGEAIGHMGQVPVMSGGVVFRPGKFGKGLQCGQAATNLAKNPRFEVNVSDDWTYWASGTGGSISRSAAYSYVGNYSAYLMASTNISGFKTVTNISLDPGQTIWFQARIWRWGTTAECTLNIYDQTNTTLRSTYSGFTKTREFELGVVSWTNDTGSTVNVRGEIRNETGNGASAFFIDAVQLEYDNMTQYFDGSFGTGHAWASTEHNSNSTRTQGVLYYNLDMPDQWTVSFWFNPFALPDETTEFNNLFQWSYDNNNRVLAAYHPTGDYLYVSFIANGTNWTASFSGQLERDVWHYMTITFDSSTVKAYLNGVQFGENSPPAMANTPDVFRFGYAANNFPGILDDLAIASSAYDDDLIRAIYESEAPLFAETSTWSWRGAANLLSLDGEGMWMVDEDGGTVLGVSGVDSKSWGGATLDKGDILFGRYGGSEGAWWWFDRDGVTSLPYLKMGYGDVTVWQFDAGGATLNGVLDISTTGGIWQGTGSFASPTTGLKIWNDGGVGRIAGYNSGTLQAGFGTDGKFTAGGNVLSLSENGIQITLSTIKHDVRSFQFINGATVVSRLAGYYDSGYSVISVETSKMSISGVAEVIGQANSGYDGKATLKAISGSNESYIEARAGTDNYIYANRLLDANHSLRVGSSAITPAANTMLVADYAVIFGGMYAGANIDPGTGNIKATGDVLAGGGVAVGDATINPPSGVLAITDGVTAPGSITGMALVYIDSSDGDLKIRFADGTVKTIITDT